MAASLIQTNLVEIGLDYILALSRSPVDQVKLLRNGEVNHLSSALEQQLSENDKKSLVETLLELYTQMNSIPVKVTCLEIFRNLSRSKDNRLPLFTNERLMDILMKVVKNEQPEVEANPELVELALGIFTNLAVEEENKLQMCLMPELLDRLLYCATSGSTLLIREKALKTVDNLALSQSAKTFIFVKPLAMNALIDCASHPTSLEIVSVALSTLNNLAHGEVIKLFMFDNQALMDVILSKCELDEQSEAREKALGILMTMACSGLLRERMFKTANLMETLVATILSGERNLPSGVTENAVGTLHNIALNKKAALSICKNRHLIYALQDLWLSGGSDTVKQWSLDMLHRLGFSSSHVHYLRTMWVLSSVREVPRIGNSSAFRLLNRDLLRELSKMLCPALLPIA